VLSLFRSLRLRPAFAVLAVSGAALGLGLAIPVLATTQAGPLLVTVSTTPNPYAIEGTTSVTGSSGVVGYGNSTSATGMAGVKGEVKGATSIGVEGVSLSTSTSGASMGVYGVSANGVGVYGQSTSDKAASIYGLNGVTGGTAIYGGSVGQAVLGESSGSNGIVGITTTNSTATGSPSTYAGVVGIDNSSDGDQSGVYGVGVNGAGVYGSSKNGNGVAAVSTNSTAIDAQSYGGYGISAVTFASPPGGGETGVYGVDGTQGTLNYGVEGESNYGTGVFGTSAGVGVMGTSTGSTGVVGKAANGGVVGSSTAANSVGVAGDSSGNDGIGVQAVASGASATGLSVSTDGGGAVPIRAYNSSVEIMSLDSNGNMILKGTLTQTGDPAVVIHDPHGVGRTAYAAAQTQATIEDFGEGRLAAGHAFVRLDPAFADLLDRNSTYMVFLTPEGLTATPLCVTAKSRDGFDVGEASGRSNIAFSYRILARPNGASQSRLALYAPAASTPPRKPAMPYVPAPGSEKIPKRLHPAFKLGPMPSRIPPPAALGIAGH
jgi:hypothetical protein